MRKEIIVIGAGKIGINIATKLSLANEAVIVIDKNPNKLSYLPVTFSGFSVQGNACDYPVLEKNYANTAKMIIIATPNDDDNILIAHMAKFLFDIPKVIVRLNDPNKGLLLENQQIEVVYPYTLSVNELDNFLKELD